MTEHEDKPSKRVGWKWIVLIALPLLLLLAYFGWRITLKFRIQRERAWFRAQGLPGSAEELNDLYPRPKGDNAADAYQDALNAAPPELFGRPFASLGSLPTGSPLSAKQEAEARAFVRSWSAALGYAERAAAIPECRFPVDLSKGWNVKTPYLFPLRRVTRALEIRALLRASEGETSLALDDAGTLLGIARSLAKSPICYYLASDNVRKARLSLERALSLGEADATQLREVAEVLGPTPLAPAFVSQMTFEGLAHSQRIRDVTVSQVRRIYSNRFPLVLVYPYVYGPSGMRDVDCLDVLRTTRRAIQTVRNPPPSGSVAGELSRLTRGGPASRLARHFRYTPSGVWRQVRNHAAHVRVLQAGLAVERYRVKHGRLPASIKDTVPEFLGGIPLDPIIHKPLRYRKLPGGFVVYSVGWNGRDDLGLPNPKGDDISFRILREAPKKGATR